jgi:hypothetical protein
MQEYGVCWTNHLQTAKGIIVSHLEEGGTTCSCPTVLNPCQRRCPPILSPIVLACRTMRLSSWYAKQVGKEQPEKDLSKVLDVPELLSLLG